MSHNSESCKERDRENNNSSAQTDEKKENCDNNINDEKFNNQVEVCASTSTSDTTRSVPLILDGTFFTIKRQLGLSISAECSKCKRIIKGRIDATTNFRNHLKISNHSLEEYENYRQRNFVHPTKRPSDTTKETNKCKKLKQTSLANVTSRYEQQTADQLILDFVVHTMSPLAVVEHDAFINLITGINKLKSPVKVYTRKTLSKRINAEYSTIVTCIREELKSVKYICTTADIWSSSKRSYMGMTVHWITDKFERKSAALACRRFKGNHTYDKITELIIELHTEFIDTSKTQIMKTVTDNGPNIVKAFIESKKRSEFLPEQNYTLNQLLTDETLQNILEIDYEEENDDDDDELTMIDISEIFKPIKETDADIDLMDSFLPDHQRCISHTLNLILTTDITRAYTQNANSMYSRVYHSAFGKCTAIWNLTSKSPKACEIYLRIAGRSPTSPCRTRWNSTFDCLENLMKVKENLHEICNALDLPKFKENEMGFLLEYLDVVRPIAEALDKLQGSKNTFYGELIPQLIRIRKVATSFQLSHLKFCSALVSVILQSLQKRFAEYYSLSSSEYYSLSSSVNDAILATVTHPFFKLRWASKEDKKKAKQLLLHEVERLSKNKNASKKKELVSDQNSLDDDYFMFNHSEDEDGAESTGSGSDTSNGNLQALQYLQNDEVDLSILDEYPMIKTLFIKYNTPLPSSAPVERLFSYAGMIMRPKRRCMMDKIFEMLLVIKANPEFKSLK